MADAGVTEAVIPSQFSERLNAIVASALDMMNAKMPELARDPYESSTEYQARVAQAYAVFQRREAEFYARNTRMYVVSIPVKDVKYDADREVVEFAVDPMALPTTHSFAAADGARLSVACYTRPYFWCSPDSGMSYDGTDLWRVPRANAPARRMCCARRSRSWRDSWLDGAMTRVLLRSPSCRWNCRPRVPRSRAGTPVRADAAQAKATRLILLPL